MKKTRIAASWLVELLDDNGYVVGALRGDPEEPLSAWTSLRSTLRRP